MRGSERRVETRDWAQNIVLLRENTEARQNTDLQGQPGIRAGPPPPKKKN